MMKITPRDTNGCKNGCCKNSSSSSCNSNCNNSCNKKCPYKNKTCSKSQQNLIQYKTIGLKISLILRIANIKKYT